MSHTYTNVLIHALFSTKDRQPSLAPEIRDEMFHYLGGADQCVGRTIVAGEWAARPCAHAICAAATLSIADVMEKVKANSSGWVKERWPERRHFGWQAGYAAFSVSKSHVEQVKRYIRNQEEHHRKIGFIEEVVAFLDKHGVEYDPRYVFV